MTSLSRLSQPLAPDLWRQTWLVGAGRWLWDGLSGAALPRPRLLAQTLTPEQEALLPLLETHWREALQGSVLDRLNALADLAEQALPLAVRKRAGIYYTPPLVAAWLVERACVHLGPQQPPLGVLDPACGSGRLLWTWAARCLKQAPEAAVDCLGALVGVDLDAEALELADFGLRCLWQAACPGLPHPSWRLLCQDALAASDGCLELARLLPLDQVGLVLSNPPYLGEKHHRELFSALQQGYWSRDYHGRGDLYYYFFYLALELVPPDCLVVYLTPSYWLTASGAQHLRQRLQAETRLVELVDLGERRLFDGAAGHHNAVTIWDRCQEAGVSVTQVARVPGRGALDAESLAALPYRSLVPSALFSGPRLELAWSESGAAERALARLDVASERLGHVAQVRQGMVTGADRLSPGQRQRWGLEPPAGSGIFVLGDAEAAPWLREPELAAWLRPWYKNSDLAPWVAGSTPRHWLIDAHREAELPPKPILAHLLRFQPLLAARREVQQGRMPWWQLQWPREPGLFAAGPKLLLPQRARSLQAAWTDQPWYASADVYLIRHPEPETLLALAALLNAPLYTCWLLLRGKRKGGLLELYQQPLSQLPLPVMTPAQRRALAQFTREALRAPGAVALERLHGEVCALFGLTSAEQAVIWDLYQRQRGL
ncbi:MAG: Eco57I restriction-modification methylase domain-containing protein [Candidatus Sericytochromatia bacterium]